MERKRVLVVGHSCLDIISVHDHFPIEDEDIRAVKQLVHRGGNAGNTSVVLAQLGTPVEYAGALASDMFTAMITRDFHKHNVNIENCCYRDDCDVPITSVILNTSNGSRTILKTNNTIPELTIDDFANINQSKYCWIHFEGRNISNVLKMIESVNEYNKTNDNRITVSVELEKPMKPGIDQLLAVANVVFISKVYAMERGYTTSESALSGLHNNLKEGATLICAWGDRGAWGREPDGSIIHAPPHQPEKVVDTLGAGDTFNGGVIWALSHGKTLKEALKIGCDIAGRKCGVYGLSGITTFS